jgi:hypothetical protein
MGTRVAWTIVARRLIERRKTEEDARCKRRCFRKHEYVKLPSYERYTNSGRMQLESFERAKRRYFELRPDFRLGYMQKRLEEVITVAFLRRMFQNDLIANLTFLSRKFLIDELNDAVAILYPRRSGKTEASAWLIALICVSQPNGNCIMYNLTHKQAKEFLQAAVKHLNVFRDDSEFGWELVQQDVRIMIEIKTNKYGTNNSIKSYPSALTGDAKIGHDERDLDDEEGGTHLWGTHHCTYTLTFVYSIQTPHHPHPFLLMPVYLP